MESRTISRPDVAYPTWSAENAIQIQKQMGRPAGEAMIAVDSTSHIVYANNGMADLFGWKPAELVGLPLNAVIPQRHHTAHLSHVAAFIESNSPGRTIERPGLYARLKNGNTFECALTIARVGTGAARVLIASIRPRGTR